MSCESILKDYGASPDTFIWLNYFTSPIHVPKVSSNDINFSIFSFIEKLQPITFSEKEIRSSLSEATNNFSIEIILASVLQIDKIDMNYIPFVEHLQNFNIDKANDKQLKAVINLTYRYLILLSYCFKLELESIINNNAHESYWIAINVIADFFQKIPSKTFSHFLIIIQRLFHNILSHLPSIISFSYEHFIFKYINGFFSSLVPFIPFELKIKKDSCFHFITIFFTYYFSNNHDPRVFLSSLSNFLHIAFEHYSKLSPDNQNEFNQFLGKLLPSFSYNLPKNFFEIGIFAFEHIPINLITPEGFANFMRWTVAAFSSHLYFSLADSSFFEHSLNPFQNISANQVSDTNYKTILTEFKLPQPSPFSFISQVPQFTTFYQQFSKFSSLPILDYFSAFELSIIRTENSQKHILIAFITSFLQSISFKYSVSSDCSSFFYEFISDYFEIVLSQILDQNALKFYHQLQKNSLLAINKVFTELNNSRDYCLQAISKRLNINTFPSFLPLFCHWTKLNNGNYASTFCSSSVFREMIHILTEYPNTIIGELIFKFSCIHLETSSSILLNLTFFRSALTILIFNPLYRSTIISFYKKLIEISKNSPTAAIGFFLVLLTTLEKCNTVEMSLEFLNFLNSFISNIDIDMSTVPLSLVNSISQLIFNYQTKDIFLAAFQLYYNLFCHIILFRPLLGPNTEAANAILCVINSKTFPESIFSQDLVNSILSLMFENKSIFGDLKIIKNSSIIHILLKIYIVINQFSSFILYLSKLVQFSPINGYMIHESCILSSLISEEYIHNAGIQNFIQQISKTSMSIKTSTLLLRTLKKSAEYKPLSILEAQISSKDHSTNNDLTIPKYLHDPQILGPTISGNSFASNWSFTFTFRINSNDSFTILEIGDVLSLTIKNQIPSIYFNKKNQSSQYNFDCTIPISLWAIGVLSFKEKEISLKISNEVSSIQTNFSSFALFKEKPQYLVKIGFGNGDIANCYFEDFSIFYKIHSIKSFKPKNIGSDFGQISLTQSNSTITKVPFKGTIIKQLYSFADTFQDPSPWEALISIMNNEARRKNDSNINSHNSNNNTNEQKNVIENSKVGQIGSDEEFFPNELIYSKSTGIFMRILSILPKLLLYWNRTEIGFNKAKGSQLLHDAFHLVEPKPDPSIFSSIVTMFNCIKSGQDFISLILLDYTLMKNYFPPDFIPTSLPILFKSSKSDFTASLLKDDSLPRLCLQIEELDDISPFLSIISDIIAVATTPSVFIRLIDLLIQDKINRFRNIILESIEKCLLNKSPIVISAIELSGSFLVFMKLLAKPEPNFHVQVLRMMQMYASCINKPEEFRRAIANIPDYMGSDFPQNKATQIYAYLSNLLLSDQSFSTIEYLPLFGYLAVMNMKNNGHLTSSNTTPNLTQNNSRNALSLKAQKIRGNTVSDNKNITKEFIKGQMNLFDFDKSKNMQNMTILFENQNYSSVIWNYLISLLMKHSNTCLKILKIPLWPYWLILLCQDAFTKEEVSSYVGFIFNIILRNCFASNQSNGLKIIYDFCNLLSLLSEFYSIDLSKTKIAVLSHLNSYWSIDLNTFFVLSLSSLFGRHYQFSTSSNDNNLTLSDVQNNYAIKREHLNLFIENPFFNTSMLSNLNYGYGFLGLKLSLNGNLIVWNDQQFGILLVDSFFKCDCPEMLIFSDKLQIPSIQFIAYIIWNFLELDISSAKDDTKRFIEYLSNTRVDQLITHAAIGIVLSSSKKDIIEQSTLDYLVKEFNTFNDPDDSPQLQRFLFEEKILIHISDFLLPSLYVN